MKIIAISDIHGFLPEITEPADIMLLGGDISPLQIQFNKPAMKTWLETEFAYWIKSLPVDKVYMIAGNHDAYFEGISPIKLGELKKVCDFKLIYLENTHIVHRFEDKEYIIFGTPYCHIFGNWPFMRSEEYMEEKFKQIPEKCDIVLSHDPPFALGDVDVIMDAPVGRIGHVRLNEHLGNRQLTNRLQEIDYDIVICGHIHGGEHTFNEVYKTVNVSYLNEFYKPTYNPFYFEL